MAVIKTLVTVPKGAVSKPEKKPAAADASKSLLEDYMEYAKAKYKKTTSYLDKTRRCWRRFRRRHLTAERIWFAMTIFLVGINFPSVIMNLYVISQYCKPQYFLPFEVHMSKAVTLLFSGAIVALTSHVVGAFAAKFQKRWLFKLYLVMLFITDVILFVAIFRMVFKVTIPLIDDDAHVNAIQRKLITEYGVDLDNPERKEFTNAWNDVQQHFRCCGISDARWDVYMDSAWFTQNLHKINSTIDRSAIKDLDILALNLPVIPDSCCRDGACPKNMTRVKAVYLDRVYFRGCYTELKNSFLSTWYGFLLCNSFMCFTTLVLLKVIIQMYIDDNFYGVLRKRASKRTQTSLPEGDKETAESAEVNDLQTQAGERDPEDPEPVKDGQPC